MTKRDRILSIIFSFILSFFLFLGLVLGVAKISIMNEHYILNVLDHVDYYEGIADELNNDFANGAGAAGFHPDIYNDYISEKEVKEVSVRYIKDYFSNKDSKVETSSFKTRLNDYLHEMAKKDNIELTKDDEERLKVYIDFNIQAYSEYLSFPFIQYFIMAFDILNSVIPFLLIACLFMISLSIYFISRLRLKRETFLHYMSSSLNGTALMLAIIPLYILINRFIQRVNLKPQCYYNFFVEYIERYLYLLIIFASVLIIFSVLLFLINKRYSFIKQNTFKS